MRGFFYITTPIYYVNDKPHIGHAYTSIAADVLARFKRFEGYDVKFVTGTDEHGQKIERSSNKAGVDPKEFVDDLSLRFRDLSNLLHLSNDDFIRTTEKRHKDFVTNIWNKLVEKDLIYLDKYSGWYSVRDESFYLESEIVDGKAPTGAEVEWVEEESYFFKLSAFENKLLELYEQQPDFILPEGKRSEVISFVKSGLRDLSVSRTTFKWGIKVPNNPDHVMYVWLDALFNYISALKNKSENFWPCNLHIIGKDILRFHAVYWPAFLMAADIKLPKRLFVHGWWTNDGQKISKSLGNVIDPVGLVEKFGADYVRYFLMRAMPFGNDGNFSEENFISLINAELVNNIGNLTQRTLSLVHKNCDGKVPTPSTFDESDKQLLSKSYKVFDELVKLMNVQKIHSAIGVVVEIASLANVYIDKNAPWKLKKTDPVRMHTVLYVLLEVIRVISILLHPFIPTTSKRMMKLLNVENENCQVNSLNENSAIKVGTVLEKPEIIFPRLNKE